MHAKGGASQRPRREACKHDSKCASQQVRQLPKANVHVLLAPHNSDKRRTGVLLTARMPIVLECWLLLGACRPRQASAERQARQPYRHGG